MNLNKMNQEAFTTLSTLKEVAAENELKTSWILEVLRAEHPDLTRVEFRQTAEAAGINGLTARNVFDRLARKAK